MTTIIEERSRFPWTTAVCIVSVVAALVGWTTWPGRRRAGPDMPGPALWSHLAVIAAAPRPLGSAHHDRVARYLADECRAAGAATTGRAVPAVRAVPNGPIVAAAVTNVVCVVSGRQHNRAALVIGHYDSVPGSPGAADNGATVAAMLVAIRALTAGTLPANDIVFLFSDAEESGRVGAAAFWNSDPAARRVGVVLNFDARGSAGVPLLFETGPANGWTVDLFADAVPMPLATSAAAAVYRLLPNDTDFSVFRDAGLPGLNFASIAGYEHYHASTDDLAHLDASMARRRADLLLALTRRIADADLGDVRRPDLAYFTVLSRFLVRYPARWSLAIAVLGLAAVVGLASGWLRRRMIRPRRVLACAAATPAVAVVGGGLCWVAWQLLRPMSDGRALPQNGGYGGGWYLAAFAVLATAAAAASWLRLRRAVRGRELAAGAALFSAAAGVITARYAPGAGYLLTLPAVCSAVGAYAARRSGAPAWSRIAGGAICLAAIVLTTVPVIYLLALALGPAGVPLVVSLILWIAALVAPVLPRAPYPRATPLVCWALAGVALLVAGRITAAFDAQHPRPDAVLHLTDATTGRAVWASPDGQLDTFTGSVLGTAARRAAADRFLPEVRGPIWLADASDPELPFVNATVVRSAPAEGGRIVELRLVPARDSDAVDVRFPAGSRALTVQLSGVSIDVPTHQGGDWIQVWAVPSDGVSITARVPGDQPAKASIVGRTFGLRRAGARPPIRPPGFIALPFGFDASDLTAVRADVAF